MVLAPTVDTDTDTDRGQPRRAREGRSGFPLHLSCTAEPRIPHLKARKIKGVRNSWFTWALLLLPRLIELSVPTVRRRR